MEAKSIDLPEVLRRPLYLYDLPEELLYTLTQQSNTSLLRPVESALLIPDQTSQDQQNAVSTSTSCALCQVSFSSVIEQREHVRSDFHKYNLKCKLRGTPTVTETSFNKLIGELDESISGSETSDSDDEQNRDGGKANDDTLTALLKRQAKISQVEGAEAGVPNGKRKGGPGRAPLLWLKSSKMPENISLGLYSAMLTPLEQEKADEHLVDLVKSKQLRPIASKPGKSDPTTANGNFSQSQQQVFLCMIGGGHFAAMVVSLAPSLVKSAGGHEERHARVIAHKTFHRYTTRRKQGGSQSANDAAKGNAHSAGSSLRRYNEAALESDVRAILKEWKSMIDSCQLLFIRATGVTSRRTLYGPYEAQTLRNNDPRLRGFPFSTRRATQSELMRAFSELTRLKVSTISKDALEQTDEKVATPSKSSTAPPKPPPTPALSPEEQEAAHHTSQLTALIRRSKAPALLTYLTKNSLPASFLLFPPQAHHHAPTPLHLAASSNAPALVSALITKAGSDPTIPNGEGKTPFDLAGNMQTRDAFRVARGSLEAEDDKHQWDWNRSHIPSALTQAQADERLKREKTGKEAAENERRTAELERIKKEEENTNVNRIERKGGAGKPLGMAAEKTASEKREEEARGMTSEMRMRLERERRARAAEERLKRMQGAR
ncbi:MAG: hypothetical protein Q9160_000405 [Pyrenula sp. 1 TL-2023]